MITKDTVLSQACDACMKELYSFAQPSITWDKFLEQNKTYLNKEKEWETFDSAQNGSNEKLWKEQQILHPEWINKGMLDCIGPAPFEFYYLPKKIMQEICDSYIYAYDLDKQKDLLDTIEILKKYCQDPIIDIHVDSHHDENGSYHPGYRDYKHCNNLKEELYNYLDSNFTGAEFRNAEVLQNKFFEFLDMAGKFYNWNRDLNYFNASIYLGASPSSNKESVINNWKKYRNKDIEINDEQIREEYYGKELD